MSRLGWAAVGSVLIMAVTVIAACAQKAAETGTATHPASTRPASNRPASNRPAAAASPVTPTASAPPAAGRLDRYANARFGFSFDIPAGFSAQPPPADGDGLSFTNTARTATITAYGGNNTLGRTPSEELAAITATYQSAGDTVTYRFVKADAIAVSGTTPQGAIFYHREVVDPAVIYALLWTYPAAQQSRYDPLVTATVDSFLPGPPHGA